MKSWQRSGVSLVLVLLVVLESVAPALADALATVETPPIEAAAVA